MSGSFGKVGFENSIPFSETLRVRRRNRGHADDQPCLSALDSSEDNAVCQAFHHLFPDHDFVALNTQDLQLDDITGTP